MTSNYAETYAAWQNDPEGFWADAAAAIDWFKPWEQVFAGGEGTYGRWYTGAECNTCYNALDRHVANGRGDQLALIYESPITGKTRKITYHELLEEVEALAAVMLDNGVQKGDRILIYMPTVPEAVVAMLASARIGAIHSVVFGGFAANELATRIDDAKPVMIIAASCGIEPSRVVPYQAMLDKAISLAHHKVDHCIIFQREQHRHLPVEGRDIDYREAVDAARGRHVPCVPVAATDPLYVLYTSGTTGEPKGVVRDNGGHMVALVWSMKHVFDVKPGQVWWAASDVGWVVGHSYIVYAPLLIGATSILFEGKPVGTPDAGEYWRIIEEHGVEVMFTAPTALRAIKKEDADGHFVRRHDLSGFRALYLAGERADPDTIHWAENLLGLGLLETKYGSPAVCLPGYDIRVLDDEGHEVEPGTLGNILIKLPLPPGCLPTLWNADKRFRKAYLNEFPGYYKTADAGYMDEDGYLYIMSRTDDIINVAGHRLSTGAMEEVLSSHPDVAECAVLGISDPLKGQVPCGFLVLKSNIDRDPQEVEKECISMIRDAIGPVAAFRLALAVKRLPKTRSGKILRSTIQKMAGGQEWKMPATIDDPAILDEIGTVLRERHIGLAFA
ncbi:AMP-binding protein [Brucella neotomae]|uniref:AMP-dependent synthetase and ligase n=1 Tax=Brucella neotomae 5K33 TaxID=520456 RepID=A0A7U8PY47_BRUNE|nr:AMP-binding protein [Brucella neotomae]EEY05246.1 AMP-dependent synthetase and ligase [Brucella neotomae 5K33]KEX96005.1 propionyl-CoA synthetase [Brucella neotomae 5K33]KFJ55112.1 AMP-binding enzyme family protein [Brucella neotomae 5K33]SPU67510.1 propionate-CoA ligase [Brucella neotomae]SPU70628.1 propionate-CoA ligase [Brucella neotomae]